MLFSWYNEIACIESVLGGGVALFGMGFIEIITMYMMCDVSYARRSLACLVK